MLQLFIITLLPKSPSFVGLSFHNGLVSQQIIVRREISYTRASPPISRLTILSYQKGPLRFGMIQTAFCTRQRHLLQAHQG